MELLYQLLGEDPHEHNFEQVDFDSPVFDRQLGLDGLHRVHRKVAPRHRKTILPPDLFERYAKMDFWHHLPDSPAFRIVAEPKESRAPPKKNSKTVTGFVRVLRLGGRQEEILPIQK